MNRREFLKCGGLLAISFPAGLGAALEEEHEKPVEMLEEFGYNDYYGPDEFNKILAAIRQLQEIVM